MVTNTFVPKNQFHVQAPEPTFTRGRYVHLEERFTTTRFMTGNSEYLLVARPKIGIRLINLTSGLSLRGDVIAVIDGCVEVIKAEIINGVMTSRTIWRTTRITDIVVLEN